MKMMTTTMITTSSKSIIVHTLIQRKCFLQLQVFCLFVHMVKVVLKQGDSGDEIDSPWLHLSRFQLDNTMSISPNDIVLVISHHLPYSNTAHG